jgi:alkylhydroperoxidase family enzyme
VKPSALETLAQLGLHAGMLEGYENLLSTLDRPAGVPERIIALCRLRVAAIHGAVDRWREEQTGAVLEPEVIRSVIAGDFRQLTRAEQAALALTERLPLDWHAMTDAEVATVKAHFGGEGCVGLITAIAFFDVNHRLTGALPAPAEQEN